MKRFLLPCLLVVLALVAVFGLFESPVANGLAVVGAMVGAAAVAMPAPVVIQPTVGRVVWYWPHPTQVAPGFCPGQDQPLAAIIAHVWSDSCVNLVVFDANGIAHNRTSVLLVQEGANRPAYDFCEWMPYQRGQAAKAEALQAKLDEKQGEPVPA